MTAPVYTMHVGDTRSVLSTLPADSVDLVLTSPPFLALRSYLPDDDPAKVFEQGSEATPGEFIDGLLDVVEACERVLAPHGSLVFELGDTYSGSGGAGGDYNPGGLRDGQERFDGSASKAFGTGAAARPPRSGRMRDRRADEAAGIIPKANGWKAPRDGWPLDKSLCLIPEIFRFSLVYGFNPLTGRQTPRWRARNVIRWCRPNPTVGALGDKVRPATSEMVIVCKDRSRFFDLDAVRSEPSPATHARTARAVGSRPNTTPKANSGGNNNKDTLAVSNDAHPAGAPPLDHWWHDDVFDQDAWLLSTRGYPGSH